VRILLYAKPSHKISPSIKRTILNTVSQEHVEEYSDIEAFKRRLLKPKTFPLVTVIAPLDFNELERIRALDYLLHDIKMILILPDMGEQTIRCGHLLRPRFLTFADSQMDWVVEVLKRMMALYARPNLMAPFDGDTTLNAGDDKDGERRPVRFACHSESLES